MKEGEK